MLALRTRGVARVLREKLEAACYLVEDTGHRGSLMRESNAHEGRPLPIQRTHKECPTATKQFNN